MMATEGQEEIESSDNVAPGAPEAAQRGEAAGPPGLHDPYAALRYGNFRLFVAGFAFGILGMQIQNTTLFWELFDWTRDNMALGYVGLAQGLPTILFSLHAGHVADKYNRQNVLLVTLSIVLACSLGIGFISLGHSHGQITTEFAKWTIFGLLFVSGVASTFGRPVRSAMMPLLVEPQHLSNAVTWNSTMFETCTIVGPAIGALILQYNKPLAYFIAAGLGLLFLVLIMMIRVKQLPRSNKPMSIGELLVGAKFVFKHKMILGALTLDLFAVLFGGAMCLLPAFAREILHVSEFKYGLLRAAPSVGSIIMAMAIAHMPPMKHAGRTMLLAVFGFGLATIVFGISSNFYLSMLMLACTGAADAVSVVVRHTMIQVCTPDSMRGRVSAVNQIFIGSSNDMGVWESGVTARWWGPVWSVVSGGIATLVVVTACAWRWPQMREIRSLRDLKPLEDDTAPRGFEVVQKNGNT